MAVFILDVLVTAGFLAVLQLCVFVIQNGPPPWSEQEPSEQAKRAARAVYEACPETPPVHETKLARIIDEAYRG